MCQATAAVEDRRDVDQGVSAAMRIRVDNQAHADALVAYLAEHSDTVVARIGAHELEAQLLGSYDTEAMRAQLEVRLRRWETGRLAAGSIVGVDLL
jgi:hypothetical protein